MKLLYELLIIRYGEISLKGDNQQQFIGQLIKNIDHAVTDLGDFDITTVYGRIFLHAEKEMIEEIIDRLIRVPGIVSVSPAYRMKFSKSIKEFDNQSMQKLQEKAIQIFDKEVQNYPTSFKVDCTRSDKSFPIKSPELNRQIGSAVVIDREEKNLEINVDLENPEHVLEIEIRRGKIYLFMRREDGPGGLPLKTGGKALLLLSGGIDSPVAGYLGMKRGVEIDAVYFHSPPYTSERAKEKVKDLAEVLSKSGEEITLYIPYFTEIQQQIVKKCSKKFTITIMRRMMMRIASIIAEKNDHLALITGENLGQVASQTLEGIRSTDDAAEFPILRPLITMDKNDIVEIARDIETYQISIQPYEDCCTVFVPDEPVTKPPLELVRKVESELEIDKLIENSLEKMEKIIIKNIS